MCNCGKKKGTTSASASTASTAAASAASMAGKTQSFSMIPTIGGASRAMIFGSRLEAEAARVRAGGGRIVVAS